MDVVLHLGFNLQRYGDGKTNAEIRVQSSATCVLALDPDGNSLPFVIGGAGETAMDEASGPHGAAADHPVIGTIGLKQQPPAGILVLIPVVISISGNRLQRGETVAGTSAVHWREPSQGNAHGTGDTVTGERGRERQVEDSRLVLLNVAQADERHAASWRLGHPAKRNVAVAEVAGNLFLGAQRLVGAKARMRVVVVGQGFLGPISGVNREGPRQQRQILAGKGLPIKGAAGVK